MQHGDYRLAGPRGRAQTHWPKPFIQPFTDLVRVVCFELEFRLAVDCAEAARTNKPRLAIKREGRLWWWWWVNKTAFLRLA